MEENSNGNQFENVLFWGILAYVILQLLVGLPDALQRRLGFGAGLFEYFENLSEAPGELKSGMAEHVPLGTKIIITQTKKEVWSEPNSGNFLGEITSGSKITIIGGPASISDVNWWRVRFDDGSIGWISGEGVSIDYESNRIAIKENTKIGTKVTLLRDTNLLTSPENLSFISAKPKEGDTGTIVGGPKTNGTERFWRLSLTNGSVGWVQEKDIVVDLEKDKFSLKTDTIRGTPILTTSKTDLLSEPNGNISLGEIPIDTSGVILGGPLVNDGQIWWRVRFDDGSVGWVDGNTIARNNIVARTTTKALEIYKQIALFLSLFFIIGILYSIVRIQQVRKEEKEILKQKIVSVQAKATEPMGGRWGEILEHLQSENEADWRLAIIEADVLLDEMMGKMGYVGESIGEKLKSVEKSDFNTIEKAWEAHKVRNIIAHKGSTFILTKREASRVISLYEEVFKEFRYI